MATSLPEQLRTIEKHIQAGNLQLAASMLNDLGRNHPDDARIYIAGWMLANQSGNKPKALVAAERAHQLAPHQSLTAYALALAQAAMGERIKARTSILRALELDPNNPNFLNAAFDILRANQDFAGEEKYLRIAHEMAPFTHNLKARIGNNLAAQGRLDEADQWFQDALGIDPLSVDANYGLAMNAYHRDDLATAGRYIEAALQAAPDDADLRFLKQVFAGETPRHQPRNFNQPLFKSYASSFDAHTVGNLRYRVPKLFSERIRTLYPDLRLNILDLGCGTGLLGVYLGRINGHFAGVDLSEDMLNEAVKHNIYGRLHLADIGEVLRDTPEALYEVITAADVLVYFGGLEDFIPNAYKVLRNNGHLMFSIEDAPVDGPDLVLNKSLRYSHNPQDVRARLEQAGFSQIEFVPIELRQEAGQPVAGSIVYAQKIQ